METEQKIQAAEAAQKAANAAGLTLRQRIEAALKNAPFLNGKLDLSPFEFGDGRKVGIQYFDPTIDIYYPQLEVSDVEDMKYFLKAGLFGPHPSWEQEAWNVINALLLTGSGNYYKCGKFPRPVVYGEKLNLTHTDVPHVDLLGKIINTRGLPLFEPYHHQIKYYQAMPAPEGYMKLAALLHLRWNAPEAVKDEGVSYQTVRHGTVHTGFHQQATMLAKINGATYKIEVVGCHRGGDGWTPSKYVKDLTAELADADVDVDTEVEVEINMSIDSVLMNLASSLNARYKGEYPFSDEWY